MNDMTHRLLPNIKKIVVLRPNAVGDFIFSLPCLHALKAAYPDAHLTYIGKQWHADFLRGRPGPIDAVEVIPPCSGVGMPPDTDVDPGPIRDFVERMRMLKIDLALQIFGGGHYSNSFIRQFNARHAIGLRAPGAAALDRWVTYEQLQNRRLQMLEVAALAGADTLRMNQELSITDRDRQEADRILPHQPGKPLVVIQPAASDRRRCWPAARFAAVADVLANQGAQIAVNGTQQEAGVASEVVAHMRAPAIKLTGKLSVSGLCGLLERSVLLVSNDTGPLHLALAIGTPSVGIYWLTNLIEAGPLRQDHHRPALSLRTNCPVCGAENLRTRCEHDVSFVDDVQVEEVIALAMPLFERIEQGRLQAA
jgi:ADP-heptose:LPS heptosyltransferase